jgi:Astacin (Peptidase family M12A)
MSEQITCTPKRLPSSMVVQAARRAREINPVNHPPAYRLTSVMPGFVPTPEHIAVLTTKYWGPSGVNLTVGFLDGAPQDLRSRILLHMNAWGQAANVTCRETQIDPQVRIARESSGYWSYLGTDILNIPRDQQTMNLQDFSMETLESEFHRVVRHETGHTLGFPHEHLRKELVDMIDRQKAIAYFEETQGWSEREVIQQVLTPIEESSLMGTLHADPDSIMCYQIPGSITKDGKPIVGGPDIDQSDFDFAEKIYPKPASAARTASSAQGSGVIDLESPHGWRIRLSQGVDTSDLRAILDSIGR